MPRIRFNLATVCLIVCTTLIFVIVEYQGREPTSQLSPKPTAAMTPSSTPVLNPLEIPAIQARGYTASPINTERMLGEQGGYTSSVASYQSDGYKEYALVATPDTPKPANGYPVIILIHGYIPPTSYQTVSSDYRDWIASWAKAGFVVIKPDLRGNGQSQGMAQSGHFSPDYTYDVLNLVASLKSYPLVDAKRIALAGHSMGGHVALRVAVVSRDIKATILINGVVGSMYDIFFNWPNSPAPFDQPTAAVKAAHQALTDQYGDPKTNPTFWNQASAINFVSQIIGPVQIDHDTGDSVVPVAFSQRLADALTAAHKSVSFYRYPGDDHQFSLPANHALLLERTDSFLKASL
jgi:dipeptidyl aminopeptidase/acylaminoacyl peptidase